MHRTSVPTINWATSPALGVCATLGSLLVAVALIPIDVHQASALRWPAIVMAIGICAVPIWLSFTRISSLFHPVNLIACAPIYWLLLDLIQGAYDLPRVWPEDVRTAFIAIAAFVSCLWLGAMFRPWPMPSVIARAVNVRLDSQQLFRIAVFAFALAFLRFAVPANFNIFEMLQAFTKGRWAAPWGRGALGGWDAFLDHIGYFGYVLPALTVLIARKVGWYHRYTIISLAMTLCIVALFSTGGGRRIIGVMAGSAFVVYFLSAPTPRVRHLLITAGLGVALLILMQLILYNRNVGLAAAFEPTSATRTKNEYEHLHVDDNFLRLCQIVNIIPTDHPYVTWRYFLWVAVRPVPRVFWPGKPVDPGFDLPAYYGVTGVSWSMSLIGELYMAAGLVGCCVGGFLIGRLAMMLATVIERRRTSGAFIIFGIGLLALFAGMRSGIELVLMSYGLLAWVALVHLHESLYPDAPSSGLRPPSPPDLPAPSSGLRPPSPPAYRGRRNSFVVGTDSVPATFSPDVAGEKELAGD